LASSTSRTAAIDEVSYIPFDPEAAKPDVQPGLGALVSARLDRHLEEALSAWVSASPYGLVSAGGTSVYRKWTTFQPAEVARFSTDLTSQ
jgi:hypothetical protein